MRSGVGAFCVGSRRACFDFLLDFFDFDEAVEVCADVLEDELEAFDAFASEPVDDVDFGVTAELACCGST